MALDVKALKTHAADCLKPGVIEYHIDAQEVLALIALLEQAGAALVTATGALADGGREQRDAQLECATALAALRAAGVDCGDGK